MTAYNDDTRYNSNANIFENPAFQHSPIEVRAPLFYHDGIAQHN